MSVREFPVDMLRRQFPALRSSGAVLARLPGAVRSET